MVFDMKLLFVVNLNKRFSKELNNREIFNRMFSYFYLRDLPDGFLEYYIRTGIFPEYPKKEKRRGKRRTIKSPESRQASLK